MLKSLLFFVAIAVFSGCAKAQQFYNGTCPEVESIETFEVDRYMGRWYVVQVNTPTAPSKLCLLTDFEVNESIIGFDLKYKENCKLCFSEKLSLEGEIISDGDLSFTPTKETNPFNYPITLIHQILGTDYENYAAVYSCFDKPNNNQNTTSMLQFKWILTREKKPSHEVLDMAYNAFQENYLSTDDLKEVDQSLCFFL